MRDVVRLYAADNANCVGLRSWCLKPVRCDKRNVVKVVWPQQAPCIKIQGKDSYPRIPPAKRGNLFISSMTVTRKNQRRKARVAFTSHKVRVSCTALYYHVMRPSLWGQENLLWVPSPYMTAAIKLNTNENGPYLCNPYLCTPCNPYCLTGVVIYSRGIK